MSDTTDTKQPLTLKLSFKKETLRVLDDNQLDLLDGVVGGNGKGKGRCLCLHGTRGCNTTNGDNENDNGSHNYDD
jgi:hypothetical protein